MPTKYELNALSLGELLERLDAIAKEKYNGEFSLLSTATEYVAGFDELFSAAPSETIKEALIEAIVRSDG